MTVDQVQEVFDSVFTLIFACYAVGLIGGLIISLFKRACD